ncbi:outer membrane beta-barrel protein [Mucilaginibacter sp. AW1-3]
MLPILLLACSTPVKGQAILAILFGKKIQNDNISLGVHVGLDASNLTNTPGAAPLTGLALGAYTNVRLSQQWTLSNYFIFKSARGAASVPLGYQIQPNVPNAADASLRRRLAYIEISPLIRYNVMPELSFALGPQFSVRSEAKDIYTTDLSDGGHQTVVYDLKDYINWFDIDAAADFQYAFFKGKGVRINFRFSLGLVNVYNDQVPFSAKNQYFQLGVGIPIAVGSKSQ